MPRAFGWTAVPACRSTSSERTPSCESRKDADSPTGPPPTMSTGTSSTSVAARAIDDVEQRRVVEPAPEILDEQLEAPVVVARQEARHVRRDDRVLDRVERM